MTVRRVCLDFHVVMEVDVPDDMSECEIADTACDLFYSLDYMSQACALEYDGYLID